MIAGKVLRWWAGDAAFTLLELLVVITVCLVLAALCFPLLAQSKQNALSARCVGNLRQSAAALLQVAADKGNTITSAIGGSGPPRKDFWTAQVADALATEGRSLDILYCPVIAPWRHDPVANPVWYRRTYGLNAVSTSYAKQETVTENGTNYTVYTLHLAAVPKPSQHLLLIDSAYATGKFQWVSISSTSATSSTGRVQIRHSGKANAAFLDGHVEALLPGILKMDYGFQGGFDENFEALRF